MNNRPAMFQPVIAACAVLSIVGCSGPRSSGARTDSATAAVATRAARESARDSVRAMLREFTEKMNAGDMEGAGTLYSNDSTFSWVENGALRYRSAKDVREGLLTLRNIPKIKLVYYETYVDVLAPGVATVRTEFSQTFYDKKGQGTTYGGYLTTTAVHETDGWRMRNGHTSSRRPRPE